jgi:hypothetical protein
MKIGAENKKSVYVLSVLGAFAAYMVYSNFFAGPSYKTVTPPAARPDIADTGGPAGPEKSAAPEKSAGPDISQAKGKVGRGNSKAKNNGEFHPIFQAKKKEDRVDVSTVDPTIRFDLLERAMKVPPAGGERDLFLISKTPPVSKETAAVLKGPETKVYPFVGPRTPPPPPGPPPPPPPPAPMAIPFKFYGTSAVHPDGTRTAYFIIPGATADLDEILMANEGDVLKKHFRIVQIGLDKVLVEDTQDKRRQPLNMEKENTG